LHDLRHTFGSLLIQNGASLSYVKEQMGHYSVQVTADIYGHLVPGADIAYVDQLDAVTEPYCETKLQQPATPAQHGENVLRCGILQVVEEIGGGGWTRSSTTFAESITYREQGAYRHL
jgi:hypothetical protein